MKTASPDFIIAERSWPVGSLDELGNFIAVPDAGMSITDARRAYDRGLVEMCQGRREEVHAGRLMEVVSIYAIPRKHPRRVDRPTFGRGTVSG